MSREIKFRGMDIRGNWHYGNLSILTQKVNHVEAGTYISNSVGLPFAYQVRPETVGQYTGLYDKNGKTIFEGDIIETPSGMVWLVEPMNSEEKDRNKWGLCVSLNGCGTNYFIDKSILKGEIIGDIYSTPELSKEQTQ